MELNASKPTRHLTENPEPRTQKKKTSRSFMEYSERVSLKMVLEQWSKSKKIKEEEGKEGEEEEEQGEEVLVPGPGSWSWFQY